jgi:hypothetical protein
MPQQYYTITLQYVVVEILKKIIFDWVKVNDVVDCWVQQVLEDITGTCATIAVPTYKYRVVTIRFVLPPFAGHYSPPPTYKVENLSYDCKGKAIGATISPVSLEDSSLIYSPNCQFISQIIMSMYVQVRNGKPNGLITFTSGAAIHFQCDNLNGKHPSHPPPTAPPPPTDHRQQRPGDPHQQSRRFATTRKGHVIPYKNE